MRRLIAFVLAFSGLSPALAAPCTEPAAFSEAARENAASLTGSAWSFTEGREGAPEGPGWEAYASLTAHTIGTACAADTPGFAARLAEWQGQNRLRPTGIMTAETAGRLKSEWHARRRHVMRAAAGSCPIADEGQVTDVAPADEWGKPERLLPGAYAAYRSMIAAAKREAPAVFGHNADLRIVSAWRTPEGDARKCEMRKCSRVSMAPSCSAHWGGRAIDLNVGFLPGHAPTDMDWANRVFQSRQPAYLWLVKNAHRFGFANYFAEPWHWEWNGG